MVNAVCIEEFRHVGESSHPPNTSIIEHFFPIIGRESPILTIGGEIVGWSTCLSVQIEVSWLHPHITSIPVHSDRYVSLEDDVLSACILMDFFHLAVEQELHIIIECHILVCLGAG